MAIRRRANEVLFASSLLLLAANLLTYRVSNDGVQPARDVKVANDTLYDYIRPPPCRKPIEEAVRLNELIANAWYKCRRMKRIPDEALGYQICVDDNVGIQHVVSGDRLTFITLAGNTEDFRLERTLLKISGANRLLSGLVFSSRRTYPVLLRDYAKYILLSSLSPDDLKDIRKLGTELNGRIVTFAQNRGEGAVDILKINCVDCWRADHLPRLLRELISLNSLSFIRQLHLIVKIDDNDPTLLYLWYKTLQSLFYIRGGYFALYAAQQLGECGRTIMNCQYQLAFAKVDAAPAAGGLVGVLAPVAGMGSPDEEYSRLIWYLGHRVHTRACSGLQRNVQLGAGSEPNWTICDKISDEAAGDAGSCLIYHFSIGDALKVVDSQWQNSFPSRCSINLFDPTLPYDQNYNVERASLHSVTLADENSGETQPGLLDNEVWRLATLQKLLDRTNPEKLGISLLILDLHGGEWDIFEQLLSAASVSAFSQIIMRIRVWQGEENENYRQYYTWLYQLQKIGYQPFGFRPLIGVNCTTSAMQVEKCEPNWCYELGWILPA